MQPYVASRILLRIADIVYCNNVIMKPSLLCWLVAGGGNRNIVAYLDAAVVRSAPSYRRQQFLFRPPAAAVARRRSMTTSSAAPPSSDDDPKKRQQQQRQRQIVVDPFCYRQFREKRESKGYSGTVFQIGIEQFTDAVNDLYERSSSQLKDGYAPFCKHLFVENFTSAAANVLRITPDNEPYLRTKYEARNDKELPVLSRYFPEELLHNKVASGESEEEEEEKKNILLPEKARYLDLILYSREQIEKENAARRGGGGGGTAELSTERQTAPWGIVSIKAQDVDYELPMTPITMMRNALGKEEGGSGVPLDRTKYLEAVEYWKDHANVMAAAAAP